jgi:phosphoribosylformylglycinamidine synthase subunit PurSL
MFHRIEVALKPNRADVTGKGIVAEALHLGISGIKSCRTVRVYVLEADWEREDAERAAGELLADPVVDVFRADWPVLNESDAQILEVVRKPGVMDTVATSVKKGLGLLGLPVKSVSTARKYVFRGTAGMRQLGLLADKLLANAVIEDVVFGQPPLDEQAEVEYAFKESFVPVRELQDQGLMELCKNMQLFLNVEEMRTIRDYYSEQGRDPRDVELETIAQTWSEHCQHKTFRGLIDFDGRRIENLLKSTIARATHELAKSWCWSVFKDNAGVIQFDEDWGVAFKVETHNHPSAIEPYGGAGTGIGGVIRDIMGTGLGAKPIANTDVFCFGLPGTPADAVPAGSLHPARIMRGVVGGVRDYGNRMGIPTVNGAVFFDERYVGNPLVYCGTVGLIRSDHVEKEVGKGDLVVVAGGATGRDGIHGATFSSGELTEDSEMVSSGAVQIGNAVEEKRLLDVQLQARDEGLYTAVTDCGAGGLSSAVGEMGEVLGAEVELEKIPLKYQGLSYTEMWISEAQERMVFSVPSEKIDRFLEVFAAEDVPATVIGTFTGSGRLVLHYGGRQVCDIDMRFLHGGMPKVVRKAEWKAPELTAFTRAPQEDYTKDLLGVLAMPNVASKEWIVRQYDHEVQGATVIKPLVGPSSSGPGDAAVLAPLPAAREGVAVACGINPRYGDLDPYWMAASAIDEALRNAVSVGADPDHTALLDNFSWGNTDKPDRLGALVRAAEACYDFAKAFGTPFISGKDSLNNEYVAGGKTICIPHTLLISALGVVPDLHRATTSDAKKAGNAVFLLGVTRDELGGSHYAAIHGQTGKHVPQVDRQVAPALFRKLHGAIIAGLVRACHDLSEGGLAVAAAEMCIGGELGMELNLAGVPSGNAKLSDELLLFSESNSRFLVEVDDQKVERFERWMKNLPFARLGEVTTGPYIAIRGEGGSTRISASWQDLKAAWQGTFKDW